MDFNDFSDCLISCLVMIGKLLGGIQCSFVCLIVFCDAWECLKSCL